MQHYTNKAKITDEQIINYINKINTVRTDKLSTEDLEWFKLTLDFIISDNNKPWVALAGLLSSIQFTSTIANSLTKNNYESRLNALLDQKNESKYTLRETIFVIDRDQYDSNQVVEYDDAQEYFNKAENIQGLIRKLNLGKL